MRGMTSARPPILGIIGGIGSGKSAVAGQLAREWNIARLDADRAGHAALEQGDVKLQLVDVFGEDVLDADGNVIRPAIAKLVFGDSPENSNRRQQLNEIVHPVIHEIIEDELVSAMEGNPDLIVLDAALLLEAGWSSMCDGIIYVDTPLETRQQRVKERGWDADELIRREASQLPLTEKRQRSDFTVDNSGEIEATAAQLSNWLQKKFDLSPSMRT